MATMDDYYRQKASEHQGHKPMRDAVPNGSDIRQRTYGGHKITDDRSTIKASGRMSREFVLRQALKFECRRCAAPIGSRCLSMAKDRMGEVLDNVHAERAHDGMKAARKK